MPNPMFQNVGGQMIDVRVIPIPIRADCTVRVFGIPHDMTPAEAEKIARVVQAMAATPLATRLNAKASAGGQGRGP